jgi:hypothetical protein
VDTRVTYTESIVTDRKHHGHTRDNGEHMSVYGANAVSACARAAIVLGADRWRPVFDTPQR